MGDTMAFIYLAMMAAGGTYSAVSSHQQGKAQQKANEAQAQAFLEQSKLQQAEYARQAKLAEERAGIAQVQGEQEAANRSRQLAAAIGSTYANWAGNGLLVDGGYDTLGSVLTTQATEAQADISTIKDNTAIEVWNHMQDKQTYLNQAKYELMSSTNQANALKTAGDLAYQAGINGAISTGLTTAGKVAGGMAAGAKEYGWFRGNKTPTMSFGDAGKYVDSTNTLRSTSSSKNALFGGYEQMFAKG